MPVAAPKSILASMWERVQIQVLTQVTLETLALAN
jgi:hypothetical protein